MLDKAKLNAERQSLYADIDKTIGDLVKARLAHDTQKEADAIHMMETLLVQTQQHLDCIGEMFEDMPIHTIDGIVVTDVIPNALSLKVEGLLPKDTPLRFGDKVELIVRKED